MNRAAVMPGAHQNDMHPDTLAALRLLGLALTAHPDDIETLRIYGDLPGHLADVISDWIETDDREEEEAA